MKCSSRSTTWRGSTARGALAWLIAGASVVGATAGSGSDARVEAAIVGAAQSRLGPEADVRVEQIAWRLFAEPGPDLTAIPEPGARLGRTVRFSLRSALATDRRRVGTTVGHATAVLHASLPHARAARALDGRAVIGPNDLEERHDEVGAVPLARVPVARDLAGGITVRPVAAGEVLIAGVVVEPPLIRAGEVVALRVTAPGVTVSAQAVAAEAGRRGETIRVVNPSSRRALRARVTGAGEAEVVR